MISGGVLYAKDLSKMVDFYVALNGGTVEDADDDFALITSGGTQFVILEIPGHISAQIQISDPPRVRAETPLKPVISVPDMDRAVTAVTEGGGALLPDAAQWRFKGNLVQDIVDPEGNVVQLWQPVGME